MAMTKGFSLTQALGIGALSLLSFLPGSILSRADDSNLPDKRFYYQIMLPQSSKSCEQEAIDLAQRFSSVTGLKVIHHACRGTIERPDGEAKYSA